METTTLEADRASYGATTRLHTEPLKDLQPGDVELEVERYALTANNISYARAGDMLGYWDFFPGSDAWGRVPATGWGRVVASANSDIAVGGRYFGWFPMATRVVLSARPTATGFQDGAENRAAHLPIYRQYTRTDLDPSYQAGRELEDRHALLRVLFLTGFMADAFFDEHQYYGAQQTIVLSASSKTAIGYAHCAAQRPHLEVVALTSAHNADFVRTLGCYDHVISYDNIEAVPQVPSVSIDMAGDGAVLDELHRHLGDDQKHSMSVGASHHNAGPTEVSTGPRPKFFFVPSEADRYLQAWGQRSYDERTATATKDFVSASTSWLGLETATGPAQAQAAWHRLRDGEIAPTTGQIATLLER